jgi:hypothetical protein
MPRFCVAVLLAVFATGCGSSSGGTTAANSHAPEQPKKQPGAVARADFGAEWPLTVESGTVACEGSGGGGSATFSTGGQTYALNGLAKGKNAGADIDPIWADNPAVPGLKKDISVLIDKALELCK